MAADEQDFSHLPLKGYRVIELGHSVAAPYGALVLAEMGAEVIKVERPGVGDDARTWGRASEAGMPPVFRSLNRNKKSVQIDLKSAAGIAQVKALAKDADALIQNLKPGLVDEIGIGPDVLTAENPRLIYVSIHAFGKTGPLAKRPGYDPLMQAFGGIMSTQGMPGGASVRVGTSIVDMGTGLWAAMGVLAGLLQAGEDGQGRHRRCVALRDGARVDGVFSADVRSLRPAAAESRLGRVDDLALSGDADGRQRTGDGGGK